MKKLFLILFLVTAQRLKKKQKPPWQRVILVLL